MKTINSQQEEYRAFLKNIRKEKEESSNLVKLIFTFVVAVLCAVIVCVILVENNFFVNGRCKRTVQIFTKPKRRV